MIVSIAFNDSLTEDLGTMPRPSARDPDMRPGGRDGGEVVRDTHGLPVVLGRLGSLELRLATTRRENPPGADAALQGLI